MNKKSQLVIANWLLLSAKYFCVTKYSSIIWHKQVYLPFFGTGVIRLIMSNSAKSVVILAAGKGTRMYSQLPKVLHKLCRATMVQHVIDTAKPLVLNKPTLFMGTVVNL